MDDERLPSQIGRLVNDIEGEVNEAQHQKLALVTATLQGGGAERQLAEMANYWARKKLDVTVATWSGPEVKDFYQLDSSVERVHLQLRGCGIPNAGLAPNLKRALSLRRLLARTRPDVVLSFLPESNIRTILAGLGKPVRIVVAERAHPQYDTTVPLPWTILRRALYRCSDCVVTQTREAATWVERKCSRRAVVIPNALRFLPELDEEREPQILAIGRLTRQKGFDLLLRAFARIAQEFRQWNVTIVGVGTDRDPLLLLRDRLNLSERVKLVGEAKNVEMLMARAGLVVQPSRFEGFPNVVLEAMGMGAAVISADCPAGPRDLISDEVNGRLVPVEDVNALAAAMQELMSSAEYRNRLGREARKVRARFRQDVVMSRWEEVLFASTELG